MEEVKVWQKLVGVVRNGWELRAQNKAGKTYVVPGKGYGCIHNWNKTGDLVRAIEQRGEVWAQILFQDREPVCILDWHE